MKRANQFGKNFLPLSVACAGLVMPGMSTAKKTHVDTVNWPSQSHATHQYRQTSFSAQRVKM